MLDLAQKYRRNPHVIIKSIGGSQVALNVDNGSEYKINEVSYDMLEAFSVPLTVPELVDIMLEQYNVSKERLMADSEKWFAEAMEKKLVVLDFS